MALVEKRVRTQPTSVDGTESAELSAVAVQGIDALEAYFARYLPRAMLACAVPPLVILWVAFVDIEAAVIMVLTLPLVPVFMWLIGRYTEERTRERWQALRQLSTHFLDVVRGLPTLRAFGRAEHQASVLAEVSDRYRSTTMRTLRVSFLSGSVLELAATLGVALVAVAAGWRLVSGSLGLQAGLTVIVLAPELYLPFRRLGAEYHASADGLGDRRATVRAARCPGRGARPAARSHRRAPRGRRSASSRCASPIPTAQEPCSTDWTWSCARRYARFGGRERGREEHRRQSAAWPDHAYRGANSHRGGRSRSL